MAASTSHPETQLAHLCKDSPRLTEYQESFAFKVRLNEESQVNLELPKVTFWLTV